MKRSRLANAVELGRERVNGFFFSFFQLLNESRSCDMTDERSFAVVGRGQPCGNVWLEEAKYSHLGGGEARPARFEEGCGGRRVQERGGGVREALPGSGG